MALILIVYSKTTGRVRRALDSGFAATEAELIQQANIGPGEAHLTYNTQSGNDADGNVNDSLPAWQYAVTQASGLTPTNDRYAVIAPDNKIVGWFIGDPAGCGDGFPGTVSIQHAQADERWSYDPSIGIVPPAGWVVNTDGIWTAPRHPNKT